MKRILPFVFAACLILIGVVSVHGMGSWWPATPGHNIIMGGVVRCVENGVAKPPLGATVTVTRIHSLSDDEPYEPPEPETAQADPNGIWISTFSIPFNKTDVTMPSHFEGEITVQCACKTEKIHIYSELEPCENLGAVYDLVTGRAGSVADLVLDMLSKAYKIERPSVPTSVEFVSYSGFSSIEVDCAPTETMIPTGTGTTDTTPPPASPAEPPSAPPTIVTGPVTPPTGTKPSTIYTPPTLPTTPERAKKPDEEAAAYGRCVEKCGVFVNRIAALEEELRKLNGRDSDRVKYLKGELERLRKLYDLNMKNGQQQRYTAPDGKEHWGAKHLEKLYKENHYQPVEGTERISPERQRFLDFLKGKIADTEGKLNDAIWGDEKSKEAERKKIEDEIAALRKAYEDCVKSCGPLRKDSDVSRGGFIIDLTPPWSKSGKTDTSRPPDKTDASPTPSGKTDTSQVSTGREGMRIEEPRHLEDSSGFDKTPPLKTNNIESYRIGEEPESPGSVDIVAHGNQILVSDHPRGEEVQKQHVDGKGLSADAGIVYRPTPTGMDIDAAVMVTGKGANFRKWEPGAIQIDLDGDMVLPSREEAVYIEKDSYFREGAAATFVALGAAYHDAASQGESGQVCPVTGQKIGSSEKKNTLSDGIDRSGMAAGMGLLVNQARSQITGKKVTFHLNQEQAEKVFTHKAQMKIKAQNEELHQAQNVKMSLH